MLAANVATGYILEQVIYGVIIVMLAIMVGVALYRLSQRPVDKDTRMSRALTPFLGVILLLDFVSFIDFRAIHGIIPARWLTFCTGNVAALLLAMYSRYLYVRIAQLLDDLDKAEDVQGIPSAERLQQQMDDWLWYLQWALITYSCSAVIGANVRSVLCILSNNDFYSGAFYLWLGVCTFFVAIAIIIILSKMILAIGRTPQSKFKGVVVGGLTLLLFLIILAAIFMVWSFVYVGTIKVKADDAVAAADRSNYSFWPGGNWIRLYFTVVGLALAWDMDGKIQSQLSIDEDRMPFRDGPVIEADDEERKGLINSKAE